MYSPDGDSVANRISILRRGMRTRFSRIQPLSMPLAPNLGPASRQRAQWGHLWRYKLAHVAHAPMVPVITPGVSVWSSRLRICSMKAWMPLSVKDPSEFGSRSEAYTTAWVAVRPIHPGHHLHKTMLRTRDKCRRGWAQRTSWTSALGSGARFRRFQG